MKIPIKKKEEEAHQFFKKRMTSLLTFAVEESRNYDYFMWFLNDCFLEIWNTLEFSYTNGEKFRG